MQEFTPFIWGLGAALTSFQCHLQRFRLLAVHWWVFGDFDFVHVLSVNKRINWPEKRNPGFCLFDFNGGISALLMTPYNSNLAVKTALLSVGAGERRAGRCWDTSLDPHPSPLPPSIPPLLQTFPHWIPCEESRRTGLSPPDVHLAAKQMALPIKRGLVSLILFFFFLARGEG